MGKLNKITKKEIEEFWNDIPDYSIEKKVISLSEAIEQFGDHLTTEEIRKLKNGTKKVSNVG